MTDVNKNQPPSMMDFLINQSREDDANKDIDVVVGGELITYTATLIGESSSKPAKERGWLRALSSANLNQQYPADQRLKNVREIAREAIKRGVLTEQQVNERLAEMKISAQSVEQTNESQINQNQVKPQMEVTSAAPAEKSPQKTSFPPINYDAIAKVIPLDEAKPPKPGEFVQPVVTNMFSETDTATLAGRMVSSIYDKLIKRLDAKDYTADEVQQLLEKSKEMRQDFANTVEEINKKRQEQGLQPLELAIARTSGKDGFHFNGDARPSQDFLFYFSKSKTHYQPGNQPEVRAYLTIKPQEREKIQQHFIELSMRLYEAGVDFSAKAGSVFGVTQRTDNMVFYINLPDQPKASQIIKDFLKEKDIGQGSMLAALPSPQEGLSWAMQPSKEQMELWRKISGSSTDGSFNTLVASLAMPAYLDRLAYAHRKKGDIVTAQEYEKEAERIRKIIQSS